MVVSVGVTVFVNLPLGSFVQRGVRCINIIVDLVTEVTSRDNDLSTKLDTEKHRTQTARKRSAREAASGAAGWDLMAPQFVRVSHLRLAIDRFLYMIIMTPKNRNKKTNGCNCDHRQDAALLPKGSTRSASKGARSLPRVSKEILRPKPR